MTTTIFLNRKEYLRVCRTAKNSVERQYEDPFGIDASEYTREENRILDCIAAKHGAHFLQVTPSFWIG